MDFFTLTVHTLATKASIKKVQELLVYRGQFI